MKTSTITWFYTSHLPIPNTHIMIAYVHEGRQHVNPFFLYTGKFPENVRYWANPPQFPQ